ncbi:JAB domain-containing protein [uncultured Winogradskyella sp.]|uniref:JAB domain-containing protein n=1 Tax=uncultured Winogradskyella sp. TaxID=395353 RepID=UPI00261671A9|nr:JAB domain-containing protein [uncultured Winogradskyella sp.]
MKTKQNTLISVAGCHEVQIHYKRPIFDIQQKIKSSKDSHRILRSFIDTNRIDHKEFFWIVLLTNANQVLGISEIGLGCATGVTVNIKEICQLALLTNATAILVAHNHPSGTLEPSLADKKLTEKLKHTLDFIDITLLDHIIITSEHYASFVDNNWM